MPRFLASTSLTGPSLTGPIHPSRTGAHAQEPGLSDLSTIADVLHADHDGATEREEAQIRALVAHPGFFDEPPFPEDALETDWPEEPGPVFNRFRSAVHERPRGGVPGRHVAGAGPQWTVSRLKPTGAWAAAIGAIMIVGAGFIAGRVTMQVLSADDPVTRPANANLLDGDLPEPPSLEDEAAEEVDALASRMLAADDAPEPAIYAIDEPLAERPSDLLSSLSPKVEALSSPPGDLVPVRALPIRTVTARLGRAEAVAPGNDGEAPARGGGSNLAALGKGGEDGKPEALLVAAHEDGAPDVRNLAGEGDVLETAPAFEALVQRIGRDPARTAVASGILPPPPRPERPASFLETQVLSAGADLYQRARALRRAGDRRGAEALLRQVLENNPDHASAAYDLAYIVQGRGHSAEAIKLYHRAIEINQRFAYAYYDLGTAQRRSGHLDQAVASLRRAVELAPQNPYALYDLGWALEQRGDVAEARRLYDEAIAKAPPSSTAARNARLRLAIMARGEGLTS